MTLAQCHFGIDICKGWLDVFDAGSGKAARIANTDEAVASFVAALPAEATIVFEATAPHDIRLRRTLSSSRCRAIRVNPARARDFARAAGFLAKTDTIDARMLAAMAEAIELPKEAFYDVERESLSALHRRRDQMVEARATERGRLADAADDRERASLERHIHWLCDEISGIERELRALLAQPKFAAKAALLRSLKGVGDVTVTTLLALVPELGQRSAKAIAALAGLAPLNCDSGTFRGQRHIRGGRRRVRQALYMAALAAIRTNARFKAIYQAIRQRSGKAKIAVVAVARKLLVTLNAMVKNAEPFRA